MNENNEQIEAFKKLKEVSELQYKTVVAVFCPYLKKEVALNSKGLEHIKFKARGKARLISEQFIRLKFLKLVPHILEHSHTLQEHSKKKAFENQNINSRWEYRAVEVEYFGFIAIVGRARLKVIVKIVEGGLPFFWSVIPFWKTKDPLTNQIKKVFCEGDLETQ